MTFRIPSVLLLAAALAGGPVFGQEPEEKPVEDREQETSQDPASETPLNLLAPPPPDNTVDLRYLYVDEPNGKFGEYNGLDEDHHHGVLNLDALIRDAAYDSMLSTARRTHHGRIAATHEKILTPS